MNEDTYYGNDGILYCSRCNTPREVIFTIGGKEVRRSILCDCLAREQEKEKIKNAENLERAEFRKRQEKCFGEDSKKLFRWTFENDDGQDKNVIEIARNYATNFKEHREKGEGLLLYGDVGRGKSFAAAAIANELLRQHIPVRMANILDLAREYSSVGIAERDNYVKRLNRCSLLIIDDYGAENLTDYLENMLFQIIDARYRSDKPLIITTNLLPTNRLIKSERIKKINDRIFEICKPIDVNIYRNKSRRMEIKQTEIKKTEPKRTEM